MKKIYFFIATLLLCTAVNAKYVTQEQARQKAEQFFADKKASAGQTTFKSFPMSQSDKMMAPGRGISQTAFYVFNAAEGGYAVVSASDLTPTILGYSDQGYLDMNQLPPHIKAWFDSYADQIAWLESHPSEKKATSYVDGQPISPLLGSIAWSQGVPYNDLCPIYDGKTSVTGCVATAMAQVMNFHKWPAQTTKEIPGYVTESLGLSVPSIPVGTIDWDNMLATYSSQGSDPYANKMAVAQLMIKCGTAVEMDYSPSGSGAYVSVVDDVLKEYFDYDASTTYIYRDDFGAARWNQTIYNELVERRPVIYGGQSESGGHAFVIDGYSADDLFHVNWGWGGYYNGYFLLSVLDPYDDTNTSTDGYAYYQQAIIGIQQNTGSEPSGDHDGDIFTAQTVEGIDVTFSIISVSQKTCMVGPGGWNGFAIDEETSGTITIPASVNGYMVVAIGESAFEGRRYITAVNLPNTIETIGYYSFHNMDSLKSLYIPASVENISDYAFGESAGFLQYIVDEDNPCYCSMNGILMSKDCSWLISYPSGLTGEYTIPADVPKVNNGAFSGCSLTKLTFPETVTYVGGWVATSCPNLETLVWNAPKADLSYCGFRYNNKLADIQLCEGITNIPYECFEGSAITEIDIPLSVSSIDGLAFYRCNNLNRVSFSTRVSSFPSDNCTFENSPNINQITIHYVNNGIFKNSLPEGTFESDVYENAELQVPTGSIDFFRSTDGWNLFRNIVEFGDSIPAPVVAEGDIWGYWTEKYPNGSYYYYADGPTGAAMFIPGDDNLIGAQITAIRIPTDRGDIDVLEQLGTAWLSESLDDSVKVREVQMANLEDNDYVDLILSEPYTITDKGVYVGYSCPEKMHFCLLPDGFDGGTYLYDYYDDEWYYYNGYRPMWQVRIKNHNIPSVAAHFGDANISFSYPGETTLCSFNLYNDGLAPISSIDYTIVVNGVSELRHEDLYAYSGMGMEKILNITFTSPSSSVDTYQVELVINQVNGLANIEDNLISVNEFTNLSKKVTRKVVMEEFTGTWCGWCPRGMAGMLKANDLFGDLFIGIAIHDGDEMELPYGSYDYYSGSFPSSLISRINNRQAYDPYYDMDVLESVLLMPTPVDVSVNGVWNEDRTQIIATSEAEFLGGSGYSVAYVLVADGLYNSNWAQSNYYSGYGTYSDDPYLSQFVNAPDPISDITFNDVMVASSFVNRRNSADAYTGDFSAGTVKSNTFTLTLPTEGELADAIDKSQLYVVALVFNADGSIANAAKSKVESGFVPSNNTLAPVDLVASVGSKAVLKIDLTNQDEVKCCQFDLSLPDGVTVAQKSNGKLDVRLTDRAETHSVTGNLQASGNYCFVITSMDNDSFEGNSGTLLEITLDIPATMKDGSYKIKVLNTELSVPDGNDLIAVKPADTEANLTIRSFTPGDVNNDGSVSVTDVGCVINYILEQVPSVFIAEAADLNNDGSISVTDVGIIINIILSDGAASVYRSSVRDNAFAAPKLMSSNEGYALSIENPELFIGFQMDVTLSDGVDDCDISLAAVDSDHQLSYRQLEDGRYRVICYSMTNEALPANIAELLMINTMSSITISDIRFTTNNLNEVKFSDIVSTPTTVVPVKQEMTFYVENGTLYINADCASTLKLYSINGSIYKVIDVVPGVNIVDGMRSGIYIISNRKLIIK